MQTIAVTSRFDYKKAMSIPCMISVHLWLCYVMSFCINMRMFHCMCTQITQSGQDILNEESFSDVDEGICHQFASTALFVCFALTEHTAAELTCLIEQL